ncbi:MAG: hypothetical protein KDD29_07655 [Flavobacteriales bacterium]|nr:hypothetical protein [Flavobacteriales bacterium]
MLNPSFFEDSIMREFQKVNSKDAQMIQFERYGEAKKQINILEQNLEIIKIHLNSQDGKTIDSCSFAFYSIYEKTEEYDDGWTSHQSSKLRLEYAIYNRLDNKLYYEKLDTGTVALEKWVIESTNPKSIKIDDLRKLCNDSEIVSDYRIWKEKNVTPHWESHH